MLAGCRIDETVGIGPLGGVCDTEFNFEDSLFCKNELLLTVKRDKIVIVEAGSP